MSTIGPVGPERIGPQELPWQRSPRAGGASFAELLRAEIGRLQALDPAAASEGVTADSVQKLLRAVAPFLEVTQGFTRRLEEGLSRFLASGVSMEAQADRLMELIELSELAYESHAETGQRLLEALTQLSMGAGPSRG